MIRVDLQLFGGRGGGSGMRAGRNPSAAPIGTKLEMGGYRYSKVGDNKWRTTGPNRRRVADRTDTDIKRVFS